MSYLLPTNKEFVEEVAKSIAKNRLQRDTFTAMSQIIYKELGVFPNSNDDFEKSIDVLFDTLWGRASPEDEAQREDYRQDAYAAINAINLLLITRTN